MRNLPPKLEAVSSSPVNIEDPSKGFGCIFILSMSGHTVLMVQFKYSAGAVVHGTPKIPLQQCAFMGLHLQVISQALNPDA